MKALKRLILPTFVVLFSIHSYASGASNAVDDSYEGSSFEEVWSEVVSNEYGLPQYKVSFRSLFAGGRDLISRAASRTLFVKSDLLEKLNGDHYPNKLAHPNGICLAGTWVINKANPYSGLFKPGSKALIVARASTALTRTEVGKKRAFGFAGKLFPTNDKNEVVKTGNFFTVDNLGGTHAVHFTDTELSNAPGVSNPGFSLIAYALELAQAFSDEDKNPSERQMYEISELGENPSAKIITPRYFKIKAKKGQTRDITDFRNELRVENYDGELVFEIFVNDNTVSEKKWLQIGEIRLNESIVSESCDRRLHFHHPKWKKLKHK